MRVSGVSMSFFCYNHLLVRKNNLVMKAPSYDSPLAKKVTKTKSIQPCSKVPIIFSDKL